MMKLTKSLTWPFLLLSLAATLVFMAGLAATQYSCRALGGWPGLTGGTSSPAAVFGMSNGSGTCRSVLRFWWFVCVCDGHAARPGRDSRHARKLAALLPAVLERHGLHLHHSDDDGVRGFPGLHRDEAAGLDSSWIYRIRTAAAGAIMAVAFLVFLLMGLGVDWEHRNAHSTGRADPDKPASTVATTAVPVQNVRVVERV